MSEDITSPEISRMSAFLETSSDPATASVKRQCALFFLCLRNVARCFQIRHIRTTKAPEAWQHDEDHHHHHHHHHRKQRSSSKHPTGKKKRCLVVPSVALATLPWPLPASQDSFHSPFAWRLSKDWQPSNSNGQPIGPSATNFISRDWKDHHIWPAWSFVKKGHSEKIPQSETKPLLAVLQTEVGSLIEQLAVFGKYCCWLFARCIVISWTTYQNLIFPLRWYYISIIPKTHRVNKMNYPTKLRNRWLALQLQPAPSRVDTHLLESILHAQLATSWNILWNHFVPSSKHLEVISKCIKIFTTNTLEVTNYVVNPVQSFELTS